MTLTKEQRAAIKIAIRYIPCWPSACKERYAKEVLQAMIDSSEHIVEPDELIGFDLEVRWHDDYMKRFSDITACHCGYATLWIMHSSGKQEWIPLASVRRISSVEKSP